MKRTVIAIVLLLLVCLGGVLAYVTFNANRIINDLKPQIERSASSALGRTVKLGNLEVQLFPSTIAKLDSFTILRSRDAKEGLGFKDLSLEIELGRLLDGDLVITALEVSDPEVTLKQTKQGIVVAGLEPVPGQKKPKGDKKGEKQAKQPAEKDDGEGSGLLNIQLREIRIKNGKFVFKQPDQDYTLEPIDLSAGLQFADSKLKVPTLTLEARYDGNPINLTGKNVAFDLDAKQLDLPSLSLNLLKNTLEIKGALALESMQGGFDLTSSQGIDLETLEALEAFIPNLAEYNLSGKVLPNLRIALNGAKQTEIAGTINLENLGSVVQSFNFSEVQGGLNLAIKPNQQRFDTSGLNFKFNGSPISLTTSAQLDKSAIGVKELKVEGFDGTLELTGDLRKTEQAFRISGNSAGVQLEQVMKTLNPDQEQRLSGTLEKLEFRLSGTLGEELKDSLDGTTTLSLLNGTLKGNNIAQIVLDSIDALPFLKGSLLDAAPEEDKEALSGEDTAIRELSGELAIGNARVETQNLLLKSALFDLTAQGSIGFDSSLDLRAQIFFNRTFSASLVKRVKELQHGLDQDERLVVPLAIRGTSAKLKVVPDLDELVKRGATKALEKKASELLEDALGGGKKDGKKTGGLGGLLRF